MTDYFDYLQCSRIYFKSSNENINTTTQNNFESFTGSDGKIQQNSRIDLHSQSPIQWHVEKTRKIWPKVVKHSRKYTQTHQPNRTRRRQQRFGQRCW